MTTENELRNLFSKLSDGQVERVKKAYDSALVNFFTREGAEKAFRCGIQSSLDVEYVTTVGT